MHLRCVSGGFPPPDPLRCFGGGSFLPTRPSHACGNGKEWTQPSGWSIYTSEGNTAADRLANCIAEAAAKYLPSMKLRGDYSDGDIDYEEGFYILKHTMCPAVLTENGYMTNEKECRWLMTEDAIESIAMTHVDGITEYIEN